MNKKKRPNLTYVCSGVEAMDKHILAECCHCVCTDNHYVVFELKLYTNTRTENFTHHFGQMSAHLIAGMPCHATPCKRMHASISSIDLNCIVVKCRNESDNSIPLCLNGNNTNIKPFNSLMGFPAKRLALEK